MFTDLQNKKQEEIQMEKLSTIQKRQKLNDVYYTDGIGPGNAHHEYMIFKHDEAPSYTPSEDSLIDVIRFQKGPRKDPESQQGILDTDLLEIVRDRLKGFQSGEFATRENACALTHIEEALMWLNRRVEDRIERDVLGTYNK